MERFIEFAETISLEDLQQKIDTNNTDIMILRFSKLTGTVKVRFKDNMKRREIKRLFSPHKIKKIHIDFPVSKLPNPENY